MQEKKTHKPLIWFWQVKCVLTNQNKVDDMQANLKFHKLLSLFAV